MIAGNDTIAVWFSCGAASAVAAKKTIEQYPNASVKVCNNFILEEDEDNRRFLKDVEQWIGQEIVDVRNSKYPNGSVVEVWEKRRYMEGIAGAPCTLELKKEARRQWQKDNPVDWHVLGFTADEKDRHDNFVKSELSNLLPVLINLEITKRDCFNVIREAGIKLPRMYDLHYPNANCPGCVKATSPTYWNHVRKVHPEVFEHRAIQSRDIGCRLVRVNGERIFLDELDPDAEGRPLQLLQMPECGVFCEEQLDLWR